MASKENLKKHLMGISHKDLKIISNIQIIEQRDPIITMVFDPTTMQKTWGPLSTSNAKQTKEYGIMVTNRIPTSTMPKNVFRCIVYM